MTQRPARSPQARASHGGTLLFIPRPATRAGGKHGCGRTAGRRDSAVLALGRCRKDFGTGCRRWLEVAGAVGW